MWIDQIVISIVYKTFVLHKPNHVPEGQHPLCSLLAISITKRYFVIGCPTKVALSKASNLCIANTTVTRSAIWCKIDVKSIFESQKSANWSHTHSNPPLAHQRYALFPHWLLRSTWKSRAKAKTFLTYIWHHLTNGFTNWQCLLSDRTPSKARWPYWQSHSTILASQRYAHWQLRTTPPICQLKHNN